MIKLIIILSFSFLLIGCERINEGYVINKDFTPAWTEHTLCYMPGPSKYKGKGKSMTKPGDWVPCTNFHPDRWRLRIEADCGEIIRWVTVTRYEYETHDVGDRWNRK